MTENAFWKYFIPFPRNLQSVMTHNSFFFFDLRDEKWRININTETNYFDICPLSAEIH